MSLRSRLVGSFALVLLVAVAVLGVAVTRSTRQALVAQVDQRLQEVGDRNPGGGGGRGPGRDHPPAERASEPPGGAGVVEARLFAHVIVADDGTVLSAEPAGFAAEPLPLPDTSNIEPGAGPADARRQSKARAPTGPSCTKATATTRSSPPPSTGWTPR